MSNRGSKKSTLKDVAIAAGVSTATVERALNGSGRIREETKKRVLDVVKQMGYSTNDVARALQNNRSYTILTVYHTNPTYFTADFERGFINAANNLKSRGLVLKTLRTKSLAPQYAIEALKQTDFSSIDAVLIDCGGTELDESLRGIMKMGIPVATFGSDSVSSGRLFYVGENPLVSGQVAADVAGRMIRASGSAMVFQGPTSVYALNQRTQGFSEVMQNDFPGIRMLNSLDHNDDDVLAIRGAIQVLNVSDPPSCIFCNSVGGTVALHRAILYLNLPPERVPVVIGYDFNREIYDMLQLGNCHMTIYQDPYRQAFNALTYMFEYLSSKGISPNAHNYVPPHLVFKHNAYMFLDAMHTDDE